MADWTIISSLATAGGTLVLAVATFSSVRSANRAARAAEAAMLAGLRPLLIPSRQQDPPTTVSFADGRWETIEGGHAFAERTDSSIYLAFPLRNAGNGIAVLHGWSFRPGRATDEDIPGPEDPFFTRLSRDIYIPPREVGFWQGALRNPQDPRFRAVAEVITARQLFSIHILYGDDEGGQRTITSIGVTPKADGTWAIAATRHRNIDRADPRDPTRAPTRARRRWPR